MTFRHTPSSDATYSNKQLPRYVKIIKITTNLKHKLVKAFRNMHLQYYIDIHKFS